MVFYFVPIPFGKMTNGTLCPLSLWEAKNFAYFYEWSVYSWYSKLSQNPAFILNQV